MLVLGSWAFACVVCYLVYGILFKRRPQGTRYIPGPPGYRFIGNLFDVPSHDRHLQFTEWKKIYGPIFKLAVLNKTIVVINSHKLAVDLLEKRGAIYSDRPDMHMHDLAGQSWNAAAMHHNDRWRVRRRLVHIAFQASQIPNYHALIRKTTLEYAQEMFLRPESLMDHIRRSAAANIIESVYGIDVGPKNDPYVAIAEGAMHVLDQVVLIGTNVVEWLPFLRHIPAWVPWSPKRWGCKLEKYPQAMVNAPFARFKEDMWNTDRASPCMMSQCLELPDLDEQAIKEAGGVAYLGGADTTVGTLTSFILAMTLWPEHQRKAQEELDRVIGRDRLPDFADLEALPYVEAIIRETYRIDKYPVAPLSVPRAVEEDDVYEGMFIPRRATVLVNQWAILRDENTYLNPGDFDPKRFLRDDRLDPDVQNPRITFYGYGRRICPGRHFADASIFLTVATTLHCFSISKVVEGGQEVTPVEEFDTGVLSFPKPFRSRIEPRFPKVAEMIQDAYEMRAE